MSSLGEVFAERYLKTVFHKVHLIIHTVIFYSSCGSLTYVFFDEFYFGDYFILLFCNLQAKMWGRSGVV